MNRNEERLRACGAYDGDWGIYAPDGYSYSGTGATNSKIHLARSVPFYNEGTLCGLHAAGGQGETLPSLIEQKLCRQCLAEMERLVARQEATP